MDNRKEFKKVFNGTEFTSELYAKARAAADNVIVGVGFVGSMKCFLNEDYDRIISNFNDDESFEGTIDEYSVIITLLNAGETFEAYEISPQE
ncbi:MAG: hypothetical protein CL472_02555 [Acidobacteria bacterium]|nr:hypothetical protein [Acidobacteriota bacterium]|tara:strand:+ start:159 stop:434 length:276 start_codon:yes stop_codon:yes gene_type:complete